MTDNEIIKALKCCIADVDCNHCKDCPMYGKHKADCIKSLEEDSLYIINRQRAEIKELEELVDKRFDNFASEYDSNIKAEAIKEFAERLKDLICENTYPGFDDKHKPINIWKAHCGYKEIDDLVKEMTEGI